MQHVIETELKAAVDKHNASGGTVIVLDPKTGAIRGMASYPTFDPNRYNDYKPEMYNLQPGDRQALRARLDLQDRDGLGRAASRAPSPPIHRWTTPA